MTDIVLDLSLIGQACQANNLAGLQRLNAQRLQAMGWVDLSFVTEVTHKPALNLGQGIWLSDSQQGNLANGAVLSRLAEPVLHQGQPLMVLLSLSVIDDQPFVLLNHLGDLLQAEQGNRLWHGNADELRRLLLPSAAGVANQYQAEFIIRNRYGLHARPGTVLVNIIKGFNSVITITNLDGSCQPVNGRSLMKVVALGIKQGHHLQISAVGADAESALQAIGLGIAQGLGEGLQ